MPSPLFRAARILASPQGRRAIKRANDEVRKQLAKPENKERLAKAQEKVREQMADPKNKERLETLKSRLIGKDTPPDQKPGGTASK